MVKWGRYRLVRPIGRGGQARVWEAELLGPSGSVLRVALKQFRAGGAPEQEGRIGGLLRHPNLLDVYEVGAIDGQPFCAMELCDGGSLVDRIPLPPRAVVEAGLQVAAALGYAWSELGLVHLDLKPANLLLSGATVKVADLGIARARGFEGVRGVRGTRGYMSPEQARGGPIDTRSDVWALGIVLAELASGSRTGHTPSPTIAYDEDAPADEPPAPERSRVAWLEPLLAQCLDPDPRGRFQTMEDLAAALRALDVPGPSLAELVGPVAAPAAAAPEAPIGREAELAEIAALLAAPGLVTLKGPGGIGKSHLARAVAPGGAWASLDGVQGNTGLLLAAAAALGVVLGAGTEAEHADRIGFALAARAEPLLVLDGFEGALAHTSTVAGWLERAPAACILATSQRPLGLPGERVVEVGSLAPPAAVRLIAHRAAERGHDVVGDPVLAQLAAATGGIPLALELAAGRIGVLSPREVLDRLGLAFLRSTRADRHGALTTTLDWSWEQLEPAEQVWLGQLSVLRGRFDLRAAEAVLGAESGALSAIDALLDHSLVERASRAASPGDARFALSRPIREHAAARLVQLEGGPRLLAEAEVRHGAHYARVGPQGPDPSDRDNVIEACRRAVARADRAVAVATCRIASDLLDMTGPYREAAELAQLVGGLAGLDAAERAKVGQVEVWALQQLGCSDEAVARADGALADARAAGDTASEALLLRSVAIVHRLRGRPAEAEAAIEAGLAVARSDEVRGRLLVTLGGLRTEQSRWADARACFEQARAALARLPGRKDRLTIANLGVVALNESRHQEALDLQREALRLCREVGDRRGEAQILGDMGLALANLARWDEAEAAYVEAIAAHRAQGNRRFEGIAIYNLGWAEHQRGRRAEAEARYAEALAIQRAVGNRRSEGIILGSWGALLDEAGRPQEGEALLRDAIAVHRAVGNRRFEGQALGRLARALLHLDRGPEAREAAAAAVVLAREAGNPKDCADALCDRAEVERAVGAPEIARAAALEATEVASALPDASRDALLARLERAATS